MKIALNFVVSLVAFGGLLLAPASQATNIAELPLKASVLAKPNVVFAMDESGSMDAEVMIDGTFQGWFYGNYQNATLYPAGQRRSGAASGDWSLFYLFPNGSGSGNRVYADPDVSYGYAIPPTGEVAWTRSSAASRSTSSPSGERRGRTRAPTPRPSIISARSSLSSRTPAPAGTTRGGSRSTSKGGAARRAKATAP